MGISNTLTFKPQQITSVDLVASAEVGGVYFNGSSNDGVGSTFVVASNTLFDGVSPLLGQRIIFPCQVDTTQNGIYSVTEINVEDSLITLTRAQDFQCAEQIRFGYYVFVSSGNLASSFVFVVSNNPNRIGFDPVLFSTSSNAFGQSILTNVSTAEFQFPIPGFTVNYIPSVTIMGLTTPAYVIGLASFLNNLDVTFNVAPGADTQISWIANLRCSR